MLRTISLTTALAGLVTLPASHAAAEPALLIAEQQFVQDGYEVEFYVTDAGEGGVLSEATLNDPATGDIVDMWTDGESLWWHGTINGDSVEGSMPIIDLDPQAALFCLTPATAIICVGAILIATKTGCRHLKDPCGGSTPTEVPGGAGGVPEGGGDGDGDSGDDDDPGGGGDGD